MAEQPVYARRRLERSRINRTIAGVCGGFAEYFGWDVTIVRIVMVLLTVFGVGSPVVAYVIAWLVMPNAPLCTPTTYAAPPSYNPPTAEPGAPAQQV
jgi:phage shock protein PspC (stress-responsive transcriptional regulator)